MEMHQIRYFLAVAETLNLTRAAKQCQVSPPSLVRAIKLLEAEFGGPLFRRERSRTHMTELGQIALPYLSQIAAAAERAKVETARVLNLEKASLRLGIMCTIAPTQFLTLLADLRAKHPNVLVTILDADATRLDALLLSGELDAAIYARPGKDCDVRLHERRLFSEEMVIVISEMHELAGKPVLIAQDLANLPYIERINCEFSEFAEEAFNERMIDGPTICRSERDDWVLGMVAQNLGYGFMPVSLAKHQGVVARRLEDMPFSRNVSIFTVRGRQHSPGVGAFMREISRFKWACMTLAT